MFTCHSAKYNVAAEVAILANVFMARTVVSCSSAYYPGNYALLAIQKHRKGHIILPFVLIVLGIYMLLDPFAIAG